MVKQRAPVGFPVLLEHLVTMGATQIIQTLDSPTLGTSINSRWSRYGAPGWLAFFEHVYLSDVKNLSAGLSSVSLMI